MSTLVKVITWTRSIAGSLTKIHIQNEYWQLFPLDAITVEIFNVLLEISHNKKHL